MSRTADKTPRVCTVPGQSCCQSLELYTSPAQCLPGGLLAVVVRGPVVWCASPRERGTRS